LKHLRQPNGWSCMATSFAMVLDTTVEEIFKYTGHDGSAVAFPSLNDPHCRRGHTLYEMVHFALTKGKAIVPFQPTYAHMSLHSGEQQDVLLNPELIDQLYAQSNMVLLGRMPNGSSHAAVWNYGAQIVFDPNGSRCFREQHTMNVELFLLCLPLKWPLTLPQKHENI
jgi:hypothetical protein